MYRHSYNPAFVPYFGSVKNAIPSSLSHAYVTNRTDQNNVDSQVL